MGNEGVATVEGFVEDGTVENKLKVGDKGDSLSHSFISRSDSDKLTLLCASSRDGLPSTRYVHRVASETQVTHARLSSPGKGTWASHANIAFTSLIPLPNSHSLTHPQSATLAINPPTAYRMLSDFIPLNPHEQPSSSTQAAKKNKKQWVVQNGANSAVGQAVIQICREWGVGTINLVRDRPDIDGLKRELSQLGADHVLTYDEFLSRDFNARQKIKEWIGTGKEDGGDLLLGLNCVGGKETTEMAKLLGVGGQLGLFLTFSSLVSFRNAEVVSHSVTYGGMAKTALAIPPSLFIFKKLTS